MESIVKSKRFWAERCGFLPIHLSYIDNKEQYIMSNGSLYDFCLDLTNDDLNPECFFSTAWSSDVKNYIAFKGEDAFIYNWSRKQAPDRIL